MRVLGIMSEEEARLMVSAHQYAMDSTIAMHKDISPREALGFLREMMNKTAAPGYWMYEESGVLRPAIEAYLADAVMSDDQIGAMRAYLRQWIQADWMPGAELDKLRSDINALVSREAIEAWLNEAMQQGIDPL